MPDDDLLRMNREMHDSGQRIRKHMETMPRSHRRNELLDREGARQEALHREKTEAAQEILRRGI